MMKDEGENEQEETPVEITELVQDAYEKYQRVIESTIQKLKVPFANSGTDLSVLDRFGELWSAKLVKSLDNGGTILPPPPGSGIPQGDGNNGSSSSDSDSDDLQTVASSKYHPYVRGRSYAGSIAEGNEAMGLSRIEESVIDLEEDGMGNQLGLEKGIGPDDDMSDEDDMDKNFVTGNAIHCVIKKLTRSQGVWRMNLQDGVMNVDGHDHFFKKATVEAKW